MNRIHRQYLIEFAHTHACLFITFHIAKSSRKKITSSRGCMNRAINMLDSFLPCCFPTHFHRKQLITFGRQLNFSSHLHHKLIGPWFIYDERIEWYIIRALTMVTNIRFKQLIMAEISKTKLPNKWKTSLRIVVKDSLTLLIERML